MNTSVFIQTSLFKTALHINISILYFINLIYLIILILSYLFTVNGLILIKLIGIISAYSAMKETIMPRDGKQTRDKILTVAQEMLYDFGMAGMSIDKILEKAEITKGAFFYHFKTKDDLALALVERFFENDQETFQNVFNRACELSRDPLQQYVILIGLFIEEFDHLDAPYPGCLYATYCYQKGIIDEKSMRRVSDAFLYWRKHLTALLDEIAKKYKPRFEINAVSLADMMLTVLEGAFIVSKTLNEPKVTADQLRQYRNYIELLFQPALHQ